MQQGTEVAKSIIIKIGGGIMEIPRPAEPEDVLYGGDLPPAVFPVATEGEEPRQGRRRP